MAEYTLQELKTKITSEVYENHMRLITGPTMQEILHDTVDSLQKYIDDNDQEPAVNYYVDQVSFDPDTGALTLSRAGGIDPANISESLEGRYSLNNHNHNLADLSEKSYENLDDTPEDLSDFNDDIYAGEFHAWDKDYGDLINTPSINEIELDNDSWLISKGVTGESLNVLKVTKRNTVAFALPVELSSPYIEPDSIQYNNIPITPQGEYGAKTGYIHKLGSDILLEAYGLLDGTGGILNKRLVVQGDIYSGSDIMASQDWVNTEITDMATQTWVNDTFYTKSLLDTGQLDNRYFTETELATSGQASVNWGNLVGTPPATVLVDTYVCVNETEQLALTVQQGDVCVRTDQNKNYINKLGNNSSMSDWQELLPPTSVTLETISGLLPVAKGGTGKVTIGIDKFLYGSATGVYSEASLTSFARTLLDDSDAETMRSTLNVPISSHNHNLADLSEKSYNNLDDKPTIPDDLSDLNNNIHAGEFYNWDKDYDDLINKPSINEIELDNNTWLISKDITGTDLNVFKVTKRNTLAFALPVELSSPYLEPDSIQYHNIALTPQGEYEKKTGYIYKLGSDNLFEAYGLMDGTGGLTDKKFIVSGDFFSDNITSEKLSNWDTAFNWDKDYNDLINTPTIPDDLSDLNNDIHAGEFYSWDKDYNDLINTPTIPDDLSDLNNDIHAGEFFSWDKDYNDLINTPTIPDDLSDLNNDIHAGEFFSWDKDYNDMINTPTIPVDLSDLNNDINAGEFYDWDKDYDDLINKPSINEIELDNNTWLISKDIDGLDLNVFKVTERNTLAFALPAELSSPYLEPDSIQYNNIELTRMGEYGEKAGYIYKLGSDVLFEAYGLMDGTGGLTEKKFIVSGDFFSDNITSQKLSNWDTAFNWDKDYNDLINTPTIPDDLSDLNNDIHAGEFFSWDKDYNDLINTPTIPVDLSDLNNDIHAGEFYSWDKDYNDMINTPTIPDDLSDLNNDINAGEFFSWDKDYNDMINTPTIPVDLSDLNNDINAGEFFSWDKDYDDLTNTPELFSDINNNTWYQGKDFQDSNLNFYKVTERNTLSFALPVELGSLYYEPDSSSIFNIPLTSEGKYGEKSGYFFKLAGDNLFEVSALLDGTGGFYDVKLDIDGDIYGENQYLSGGLDCQGNISAVNLNPTGDITLADGKKIIFGDQADAEMYWNNSSSIFFFNLFGTKLSISSSLITLDEHTLLDTYSQLRFYDQYHYLYGDSSDMYYYTKTANQHKFYDGAGLLTTIDDTGINIPSGSTFQIDGVDMHGIRYLSKTLNYNDLSQMSTNPVTLIPAPGPGKVIVVFESFAENKVNDSSYHGGDMNLMINSVEFGEYFNILEVMNYNIQMIRTNTPYSPANTAFILKSQYDDNCSNDGSTVVVHIWYKILTL